MNTQQLAILNSNTPNTLVVAGPGSGKTTLLVESVVRCCERYGPEKVICITFTTAGAAEMKKRLAARGVARVGYIGTLHAFMLKLLRSYYRIAVLPCVPSVIDDESADLILEQVADEMGCKSKIKSLKEIAATAKTGNDRNHIVVMEFRRRLISNGLLTNDMLLAYGEKLMAAINAERTAQGEANWFPYEHLFVDEVQDSANADFCIYNLMPVKTRFYVGDPDQAIYGFRGGNIHLMMNLSGFCAFKLEVNYRCRNVICATAQNLIEHNTRRISKQTRPSEVGGRDHYVNFLGVGSPIEEMNVVAGRISLLVEDGKDSIAVICRTNRQAGEFRDFLRSTGIQLAEAERPAQPEGWRTAKLLITALTSPHSNMAWLAFAESALGKEKTEELKRTASSKMLSVREAALAIWPDQSLPALSKLMSSEARAKLHDACHDIAIENPNWTLPELSAYLSRGESREVVTPGVAVLTAHKAKGREFDSVFIVGLEEGNFPQLKAGSDIEEERRLMFVAMTRARLRLILTWCQSRPVSRGPNLPPGPPESKEPSRFIKEAGLTGQT